MASSSSCPRATTARAATPLTDPAIDPFKLAIGARGPSAASATSPNYNHIADVLEPRQPDTCAADILAPGQEQSSASATPSSYIDKAFPTGESFGNHVLPR